MIYYHATPACRVESIIRDNKIIPTTSETMLYPDSDYSRTTLGYVYLTTDIDKALDFGSRTMSKNAEMPIGIFEIDIPSDDVEKDLDELKFDPSSETEYRVKYTLILGKHVKRYAFPVFHSYDELCNIMESKQTRKFLEDKWITL